MLIAKVAMDAGSGQVLRITLGMARFRLTDERGEPTVCRGIFTVVRFQRAYRFFITVMFRRV